MQIRALLSLLLPLFAVAAVASAETISQLPYETGWMDLETGTSYILEPWEMPPDAADFKFAYNGYFDPHAVIFQNECVGPNCEQWVEIAYSTEAYADVQWDDLPGLTFSRGIVDVPFSDIAVLYTPEGHYYKLEFIEEVECGYELCVSYRWEEIVPNACDLQVFLLDVPETALWEETINFQAQVVNSCTVENYFDEAQLVISGPVDKTLPLYAGDPVTLAPESDLLKALALTVPWDAPVDDYTLTLTIFRDGSEIDSDSAVVTVTP